MTKTNSQPDTGSQEAAEAPVANNLGRINESSIADFIKSNFLDEEGAAPAKEEQQAEPEAETEESIVDSEVEAEEEADQPAEEESEAEESSLSKGVQKRINKLVAAKKAAQAELEAQKARLTELQQELETVKSYVPEAKVDVSDAVQRLTSVEQIRQERDRALEVILWCEDNPDGGVINLPDGTERDVTALEVRNMKRVAIKRKEVELPARAEYIQHEVQAKTNAIKEMPFLADPKSEKYQVAQQVIKDFPEVRRRPDYLWLAGIFALGAEAMAAKQSAKKPAAPIKRAPAQPAVKAAPSATSQTDLQKARQSFAKDSSARSVEDLIKAMDLV
ncbi:hypothetical protein UFOVP742_9 [uncultured Caudovirales phage]|uniref:Uncharacterized protein n=1 Tax=uncultured Caudovirales phage TaxID=2100421 RepID=A0A6J7X5E4_9CAUD|nr:hypothetical protein UFOVP742_9 [uncultured Caudovirales phage]